jgi:hypothetical protein
MAVTAPHYSDYPEFNPQTYRSRTVRPAARPHRNARRNVRSLERRVRAAETCQGSLVGGLLRSRLMDDVCAVVVGAAGLFFLIALARLLLAH